MVAPNPISTTKLNVLNKNNEDTTAFSTNNEVEFLLFNDKGVRLKSKKDTTSKTNYTLNVSGLKKGIYFLKIITDKYTEIHRILIDN